VVEQSSIDPIMEAPGLQVYTDQQARQAKYAGKVLGGKYLLQERIGEGAEGVIYRAHARYDSNQIFAVKVGFAPMNHVICQDGFPADPISRESEFLQSLRNDWFPTFEYFGQTSAGHAFLVRELFEGQTLHKLLLRREPFPLTCATFILDQLCQAVCALHENEITHRDIKPGNLILTRTRNGNSALRIVDFGAATILNGEAPSSHLREIASGTPAYTAPERAHGQPGGVMGDFYAICAIGYELLTGTPALGDAAREMKLARQYLLSEDPIPLHSLQAIRPDVPAFLCETITRGLKRIPEERGGGISILKAALAPHLPYDSSDLSWLLDSYTRPEGNRSEMGFTPLPGQRTEDSSSFMDKIIRPFKAEQ